MHSHSVASDDSRATVEQYLKWINAQRKKGVQIDGIVLSEHRQFDAESDYSDLAKQYDVLVFKGSELDTRYGHVLVYGVTEQLTKAIPFNDVIGGDIIFSNTPSILILTVTSVFDGSM